MGILAGIEGIAAAAALRRSGRPSLRFLHDRRRSGDLRLITGLGLRRLIDRTGLLDRRKCRDVGLGDARLSDIGLSDGSLAARRGRRPTLQQLQAVFELPVAVLQFLVLAGELAQLILELLNAHFRIGVVGLRQDLRSQDLRSQDVRRHRQHRGDRRGAGRSVKSG
jgi:hypothetical protein